MNELLAQAYGTDQLIEDSLEKTAEAALLEELEKVASEEGIDLDELSDDDIVEILSEVMGAAQTDETFEEVKTASEEIEEIEETKLAEADFLGRTMAHAFYQEVNEIEKSASEDYEVTEEDLDAVAIDRANEILAAAIEGSEYEQTKEAASMKALMQGLKKRMSGAWGHTGNLKKNWRGNRAASKEIKNLRSKISDLSKKERDLQSPKFVALQKRIMALQRMRGGARGRVRKGLMIPAAGAAGVAGLGGGAYALSKKSSDENFDDVIDARALQLLDEAGYDVDAVIEAL